MGRGDDSPWWRRLLAGAGVLIIVSAVVGVVLGGLALGAANILGVGPSDNAAHPTTLYMPTTVPTTSPEAYPVPTLLPSPLPSASASGGPSPTPSATPSRTRSPQQISLQAFPNRVSPGERIDLTGVYQNGEGAVLQVQRYEGGWTDFPVTTTVSGGIFSTYLTTSRSGVLRFRVFDRATDRHSNQVQVTVG